MSPVLLVFPLYIYLVEDQETFDYVDKYLYQFRGCCLN